MAVSKFHGLISDRNIQTVPRGRGRGRHQTVSLDCEKDVGAVVSMFGTPVHVGMVCWKLILVSK